MLYTSYFANLRKLDKVLPVSICAKTPSWFEGLEYKKLAPTYDILMEYKKTGDSDTFTKRYKEEVLYKLNRMEVLRELYELTNPYRVGHRNIVLVCYEKPTDFCHRHIVAEWLNINVKEI